MRCYLMGLITLGFLCSVAVSSGLKGRPAGRWCWSLCGPPWGSRGRSCCSCSSWTARHRCGRFPSARRWTWTSLPEPPCSPQVRGRGPLVFTGETEPGTGSAYILNTQTQTSRVKGQGQGTFTESLTLTFTHSHIHSLSLSLPHSSSPSLTHVSDRDLDWPVSPPPHCCCCCSPADRSGTVFQVELGSSPLPSQISGLSRRSGGSDWL